LRESLVQDIFKIRNILESFERAEFHSGTSFYKCLNGFPAGCCGDTTNLLGLFLSQEHKKTCTYVSAQGLGKNRNLSHAWLVCDSYIIDITADQFNSQGYQLEPVIISKESIFHSNFISCKSKPLNVDRLRCSPVSSVFARVVMKMKNEVR
jgi:hypothetical protein